MTNQEVFDLVVSHLRKQNCKSQDDSGICFYRGPNGTKCAAGILISDEEFSKIEIHDNKILWSFLVQKFRSLNEKYGENLYLIEDLQKIHDSFSVKTWEKAFELTAKKFGLEYSSK